jgi:hypothetical protein
MLRHFAGTDKSNWMSCISRSRHWRRNKLIKKDGGRWLPSFFMGRTFNKQILSPTGNFLSIDFLYKKRASGGPLFPAVVPFYVSDGILFANSSKKLSPSCQPLSSHVVAWKEGHFLETALLHPPQAALRWFPKNAA